MRGLDFEHQLCQAILILSPVLDLEKDPGGQEGCIHSWGGYSQG